MFYTAERAAKLVAPYINRSYPENKEEIFRILTIVNDRIWNEGSFWGMTAEFYVKTRPGPDDERYIVSPPGYDILKAVNINSTPRLPRDAWFQFHQNGCGSIDHSCGNWTESTVDLGEHSTIHDIWKCHRERPSKILIGACLTGKEGVSSTDPKKVTIQGEWDRDGEVFTYERERFSQYRVEGVESENKFEPVFGAKIALNDSIRFIQNIWWKRISSITKDITINPVEVYAIHSDQTLQLLAVIPPHATESKHRRYLVPSECCKKTCNCNTSCDCDPLVHAMFKVSEPEAISFPTQPIYTTSRESLISLAISVDEMFEKKKPESALPFQINGIRTLDAHTREKQSNETFPVQVTGPYLDDIPYFIRRYDI